MSARVVEYGYRILLLFDLHIFAQRVFTSMHLADGFIQRGLHFIESVHFYQVMHVHFAGNQNFHDLAVAVAIYCLSFRKAHRRFTFPHFYLKR